ncbi:hypothetical protein KY290_005965 [Solanum tuberosum]|uniref:Uncharacterized protein n=1 Tax=Solanum tuberosum TaxID=4113 RepID=A0ABQ7WFP8_SOLTU|nr:hypothetical protein KY290_005965 [Solanum tuberosum]
MFKIIGGERIKGMVILKLLIKKVIKIHFSPRYDDDKNRIDFEETSIEDEEVVPYDVKEGHFAIFAVNTKEERKSWLKKNMDLDKKVFWKFLVHMRN